ncbi:hypothetical protein BJ165DRAFT_1597290 [Panaeolus papilionaceus]|nr:hypothetical protein BJ165DRAFT_1597290 [Panaeolus papilionaceus]
MTPATVIWFPYVSSFSSTSVPVASNSPTYGGSPVSIPFTWVYNSRPVNLSKILFVVSRYYEILGKIKHPVVLLLAIPISLPYLFGMYNASSLWVNQREMFDEVCNINLKSSGLSSLSLIRYISYVISQLLIWLCIYANRNVGHGHVPVVKLVVRQGSWFFIVLFAIVAALMPASIVVNRENPFLTYVCPTTLISVLICRGIQSMHELALNNAAQRPTCDDEDFQLTTFIHSEILVER